MGPVERLPETARTLVRGLGRGASIALAGVALSTPSLHAQTSAPDVHVDEEIVYYDLQAPTLSAVVATLNTMRLEGPDAPPSQGLTSYYIKPEWSVRAGNGACRVVRAEISVDIDITLPRWTAVTERPEVEREGWSQIESAIREHEYGHRDLTIDAAGAILSTISGLEARGCGTLDRVMASTLSVAEGRLREAHATLDRETPRRLPIGPG